MIGINTAILYRQRWLMQGVGIRDCPRTPSASVYNQLIALSIKVFACSIGVRIQCVGIRVAASTA